MVPPSQPCPWTATPGPGLDPGSDLSHSLPLEKESKAEGLSGLVECVVVWQESPIPDTHKNKQIKSIIRVKVRGGLVLQHVNLLHGVYMVGGAYSTVHIVNIGRS